MKGFEPSEIFEKYLMSIRELSEKYYIFQDIPWNP